MQFLIGSFWRIDSPFLMKNAWGCSMSQVPLIDEGLASGKLEYLAYKFGFFLKAIELKLIVVLLYI
jgi:hypothetical protein